MFRPFNIETICPQDFDKAHNEPMFDYLARLDASLPMADPATIGGLGQGASAPTPSANNGSSIAGKSAIPTSVDKLIAKSFPHVRFSADPGCIEDWLMGFNQHPRLRDEITIDIQRRVGLATMDEAKRGEKAAEKEREATAVAAWRWIQQECLCSAAVRVALAQRTFRWLLDWKASFDSLAQILDSRPELKGHPSFAPLLADIQAAPPHIQNLRVTMADPAKRTTVIEFNLVQLEEHLRSISIYLGALASLHPFLVPAAADLPATLPPRHAAQCLDRGTAWLAARLSQNANDACSGKLLQWECDEIAKNWMIVTNGCNTNEALPEACAILRELGLELTLDAEGVSMCGATHQDAISAATRDPLPSVCAAVSETHLMRILHHAIDTLFATSEARHSRSTTPSDLPDPESSLMKKCEHIYAYLMRHETR